MNERPTQRRFAVMGDNTFKIANILMSNKDICRLLKYQTKDPFALIDPKTGKDQPDVDGVAAIFDDYTVNTLNPEFKVSTLRFDIACPYDEWILNAHTLRPYLIMQQIDTEFNGRKLAGIGNLQFWRADNLTLSPWIGGYSMRYKINEFN